ncbi:MAG: 3-carboxy-cis,cis-muconate cycloisomerase [Rhizobiales bacterium]|nr:3-carboxy-cis,cis-muconate cycloisomerase [Hyphomicrobiales bacterium]
MSDWTDAFFAPPALRDALSGAALAERMLAVEAALAEAGAEAGVVPADAAGVIAAAARAMRPDAGALFQAGARAGTLAIPLVAALTGAVRERSAPAAGYVHLGATSQDVVDTATVLVLREVARGLDADLAAAVTAAAALARAHRATPMLARTLMQPASPIVFGLRAAQWLLALDESRGRLARAAGEAAQLQFGGASGNLAALGDKGSAVAAALARRLDLALPPAPWHARRGALVAFAAEAAIALGAAAKIAGDVALLMQAEIAEAFEAPEAGRGGSSAMPHKRNPVRAMQIRAAHAQAPGLLATLVAGMAQEQERALGAWQAEWAALPQLILLAGGGLANLAALLGGLIVDPARMRANLEALRGLPFSEAAVAALAPALGRDGAHQRVEAAARRAVETGGTLAAALAADPAVAAVLTRAQLDAALAPLAASGAAQSFIDAALARAPRR